MKIKQKRLPEVLDYDMTVLQLSKEIYHIYDDLLDTFNENLNLLDFWFIDEQGEKQSLEVRGDKIKQDLNFNLKKKKSKDCDSVMSIINNIRRNRIEDYEVKISLDTLSYDHIIKNNTYCNSSRTNRFKPIWGPSSLFGYHKEYSKIYNKDYYNSVDMDRLFLTICSFLDDMSLTKRKKIIRTITKFKLYPNLKNALHTWKILNHLINPIFRFRHFSTYYGSKRSSRFKDKNVNFGKSKLYVTCIHDHPNKKKSIE